MDHEVRTGAFWRAVVAELLGTTLFVFIGIGAAIGTWEHEGPAQEVKVALAFGLAIAMLVQSLGHVSGAHLNPAVTLGFLVSCQISALRAVFYFVAQMLGAVLASGILYAIRPKDVKVLGLNEIEEGLTVGKGFGIEFLATFQLVLCVLATADSHRVDVNGSAPLIVGLSVSLGHLLAISYTGCGINPARTFGPAVVTKSFKNHWVFWVAPMLAGAAAALVYHFILQPRAEPMSKRIKVLTGGSGTVPRTESTEALTEGSGSGTSPWPRH